MRLASGGIGSYMSKAQGVTTVRLDSLATGVPPAPPAHLVHFYESEDALETAVAKFLGGGLSAGDVLTVVATREHVAAFERRLESEGLPVRAACASGQLLFLDA